MPLLSVNFEGDPGAAVAQGPGRWRAAAVVGVFALHNAWNCFVFFDFGSYGAVEALLGCGSGEVGLINGVGWVGILLTLPVVTVCRWHRTLLAAGALLNLGVAVLRYAGAAHKSVGVLCLSSVPPAPAAPAGSCGG